MLPATGLVVAVDAPVRPLSAQQAEGPEIQAVRFEGVNSIERSLLRQSIRTAPARCRSPLFFLPCRVGDFDWAEAKTSLDTATVREDEERIATLYEIWGFPSATVRSTVDLESDGDVVVTFLVTEGAPITIGSLRVGGAERIEGFRLPDRVPLKVGEPYALPRLQSMQDIIHARLAQLGYPRAETEVSGTVSPETRRADIVIEIQPGRRAVFGDTRINAERPIGESVVRDRLAFQPGDAFSVAALERSERNLYGLQIVERANADVRNSARADSIVDVSVEVAARRAHGFSGELLLSSTDCAEVRGFWQHRYFLGGPRVFALGAHTANLLAEQSGSEFPCSATGSGVYAELEYGVEADVRQYIGRSNMLIVRGYGARESAPAVYVQTGYGAQLSFARSFSRTIDGMLSFSPERNRLRAADLYFCGQYGVCTAGRIATLSHYNWRSPIEGILTWTSTTAPADVQLPDPGPGHPWHAGNVPTQRWTARLGLAAAGPFSASDYEYTGGLAELTGMRILGARFELAARVRAGFIETNTIVPPQVMLFSGGPNTVRGLGQNLLGPQVLSTDTRPAGCDPVCPPAIEVSPKAVVLRPTGGNRLLEGNIEGRLWLGSRLQVAAFLDGARLQRSAFDDVPAASATNITPGIGLRVITDLGPIRIDIGYDPSGSRRYPLFLQDNGDLVGLGTVTYDPFTYDRPSFLRETLRRLQLQMAVGQLF